MPEDKTKQIKEAIKELKWASLRIYQSASGVQPFRISKLLNVMGKITGDYVAILSMLVGDRDIELKPFELSFDTPPLKLFEMYVKEDRGEK